MVGSNCAECGRAVEMVIPNEREVVVARADSCVARAPLPGRADSRSTAAGEGGRATKIYREPNCRRRPARARIGGPTVSTGVRPTS